MYKRIFIIATFFCLSALLAAAPSRAALPGDFTLSGAERDYLAAIRERPITIGYSGELTYSVDWAGGECGLLTPLLKLLRDDFGLIVRLEQVSWTEAFERVDQGALDFYGLVGLNEARRRRYLASQPIYWVKADVLSRRNAPLISLLNLGDKKIGLLADSTLRKAVQDYIYPNGSIIYFSSTAEMLNALEAGDVDCVASTDHEQLEVMRRPALHYEFTIPNFSEGHGLIGRSDDLEQLLRILDRYLGSTGGAVMEAEMEAVRKNELLKTARAINAKDIATLRERCQTVVMHDTGTLYPMSYTENGVNKGLQVEINQVFTDLTGLPVEVRDYGGGLYGALNRLRSGECQLTSGGYASMNIWEDPELEYSPPLWLDTIRTYTYNARETDDLRTLRLGTTSNGQSYINWSLLSGNEPVIYGSRRALMEALKRGDIDIAFISEMAYNYLYAIEKDYALRELGNNVATTTMRLIYHRQNVEFNRLFNEAIDLYQMLYPDGRTSFQYQADRAKSDAIRLRDQQSRIYLYLVLIFVVMGVLLLYSQRRYAKYDRQISRLIRRQQTFDLAWGNLKTKRFTSKGDHPFFRKWGFNFSGASCSMDELSRAFGWDLYADYRADIDSMKRSGANFVVSDKMVVSPLDGRRMYFRRYMHRLSNNEFMSCLQDVTDEMTKVENLTQEAGTDFLSDLMNRRAMNEELMGACKSLGKSGDKAFLVMWDIDDFKTVNDRYGHDVGDEVLKSVARIIQGAEGFRRFTARWGGEEFLSLVIGGDLEKVEAQTKGILRAIAAQSMSIKGSDKSFHVTVSAGLSPLDCSRGYQESVRLADQGLYEAKRSGKNCIRTRLS